MKPFVYVVTALLVASAVRTQDPAESRRERIEAKIQEMRKAIEENKPLISHVRVTVRLRNGHKLKGVVKNGRVIERVDGLDFVAADMQTPGAGLRVWYYDNTNSYIFLPFEGIESYRIGAKLTDVQVKEIEDRIDREREQAQQRRQELAAARTPGVEKAEAAAPTAEELAKKQREQQLLALLEEYPTSEWSEERAHEIEARKITLGVYPDAKGKRFLEVLDDWKEAVKIAAEQEAAKAEKPPGSGEGGDGEAQPPSEPPGKVPAPPK